MAQQLGQPDGGEQRYPNQFSGRRWLPLALASLLLTYMPIQYFSENMDSILIAILTAFIGGIAWLSRFAINEYPVFKKLKIPSTIFKYGTITIFIFFIWNISANYVYSRMLPYVNTEKINEINSAIYFRANKISSIVFVGLYFFIWFIAISIDHIAESIHKARKDHEDQRHKINNNQ